MIVATVIAFVYTYRQPKIYEATCQVIIEPMAPQVLPGLEGRRRARDRNLLGEQGILRDAVPDHPVDQRRPANGREARAAVRSGLRRRRGAEPRPRRLWAAPSPAQLTVKPLKDSRLALITVDRPEAAARGADREHRRRHVHRVQPRLQARGRPLGDGVARRAGGGPQAAARGVRSSSSTSSRRTGTCSPSASTTSRACSARTSRA